ncbi:histone H1x [Alligator sinensis]|uniref:Histone H1x n=1 Tax=Alligator sinensis TaxID=38654 RepID=A0A1U7R613_ALLSI|nr:histone H1x [Alligator sinensis]
MEDEGEGGVGAVGPYCLSDRRSALIGPRLVLHGSLPLARIAAKKVAWFDQQNGRTYLKYSIKALVQNDTLLQVKGTGANGSFKLNRKKLEGGGEGGAGGGAHKSHKKAVAAAATRRVDKKPAAKTKKPEKKSHKKGAGAAAAARKEKGKAKKAAKKGAASPGGKKVKKSAKPKALKSRKA